MCDDTRQEFILLSDTFGISSLVEIINYDAAEGATENTVLGPFFVPGSPQRARGETMLVDPDEGDRVVIRGTITNDEGKPVAGAELDCWQNATHGFYAVQQPGIQSADNLRGIYTTDSDGTYEIRTVRPVPYPIPSDGPAGDMLKANNRRWMRPGHTHMWIRADGYKELITHVFDVKSEFLREDPVFGVRDSLIRASSPTRTASWPRPSTSSSTAPDSGSAQGGQSQRVTGRRWLPGSRSAVELTRWPTPRCSISSAAWTESYVVRTAYLRCTASR